MTELPPSGGPGLPSRGESAPIEDLADIVERAVLATPGVTALHGGSFGEVATYLPGRRVAGVRLREDEAEVHVVLSSGAPVLATAAAIRRVVAPLAGTPVHVTVEDIVDPALMTTNVTRTAAAIEENS